MQSSNGRERADHSPTSGASQERNGHTARHLPTSQARTKNASLAISARLQGLHEDGVDAESGNSRADDARRQPLTNAVGTLMRPAHKTRNYALHDPQITQGSSSRTQRTGAVNSASNIKTQSEPGSTITERYKQPSNLRQERPDDTFIMNMVVQPPKWTRPGNVLSPVVVRIHHKIADSSNGLSTHDTGLMWAMVSLASEDGTTTLAPPRNDLLGGSLVSSFHHATPSDGDQEVGHVSFMDLAIRIPGRYRIKVSLLQMAFGAKSRDGTNLQDTMSHVIQVDPLV